ncbi:hypothetical protein K7X08_025870 [Anisodus acutangulus]|uniref:Uncharacterized protein n=1 Tax=Anisodus acutangulus TaxID=402998 RepID=A0A9Q1L8Q8_9SOLA|nr:hypothetical protein K7X08_025870 [Anisodus acutangulus]
MYIYGGIEDKHVLIRLALLEDYVNMLSTPAYYIKVHSSNGNDDEAKEHEIVELEMHKTPKKLKPTEQQKLVEENEETKQIEENNDPAKDNQQDNIEDKEEYSPSFVHSSEGTSNI